MDVQYNLVNNFDTLTQEVDKGVWKGRENELSQKVKDLIEDQKKIASVRIKEEVPIALFKLIGSLNRLGQNDKITQGIEQLSSILFGKEKILNPEALTKLRYATDTELDNAVHTFKMLLSQKQPEAAESFAHWIEHRGIEVSKLRLSKEHLLEVVPHMEKLYFDSDLFNERDVHEIIASGKKLKNLTLATGSIKETPDFPQGIKELTLQYNKNLETISSLNEGVEKIIIGSNESLKNLPPFLPSSVKKFTCGDNECIKVSPKLNDKLEYLNLRGSSIVELPQLPKGLKTKIL